MLLTAKLIYILLGKLFKSKADLLMEIAAKDQQLALFHKKFKRLRLKDRDRNFWVALLQLWPKWKESLVIVKPETVILWHRYGFKYFWKWKSRIKDGRPVINPEVRMLIKKISRENPAWGNMRIRDELKFLGINVSINTVKKYRQKRSFPAPHQKWKTFIQNHLKATISIDMFTVPTLTFGILYGYVVISNARRKILYTSATYHPGGGWLTRQMIHMFKVGKKVNINYLIRDRDNNYGGNFSSTIHGLGIKEVLTSPQSPWQNPYAERVIGTIRTECLNQIIILNKNHLCNVLQKYAEYYNTCRPHQGINMWHDSPIPRRVMANGKVYAEQHLSGLQHCYKRVA